MNGLIRHRNLTVENLNPLEKDFAQFEKLIKSGNEESVVRREMELKGKPRTGIKTKLS